jgi:predicted ATPase
MIENVAPQKDLSRETVETVVRRATGVPLFVEELTRDVLERGEHPMQNQIPATLRDSLMARLDRLGSAREFAQIGATIGREFSYGLLNMVAGVSECDLEVALEVVDQALPLFRVKRRRRFVPEISRHCHHD